MLPDSSRRRPWEFLAAAFAIEATLFLLDHRVRFFMGDSESYLATGFGRWIPPDRSWLYGLAINRILLVTHRLSAVLGLQVLLGALIPGTAAALCATLGCRRWLCWAVLLVLCADPLRLYYGRSLMTDEPGAVATWLGVFFLLAYGRTFRGSALAASAGAFAAAACLRIALVPWCLAAPAALLAFELWSALRSGGSAGSHRRRRRRHQVLFGSVERR